MQSRGVIFDLIYCEFNVLLRICGIFVSVIRMFTCFFMSDVLFFHGFMCAAV